MPHYDYKCADCRHRFEVFQSMKEDKLTECPSCGGQLERLIGAGAGMIFKGSGFYSTDYRSESYKKGQKADKSNSSGSGEQTSSSSKTSDTGSSSKTSDSTKKGATEKGKSQQKPQRSS